MSLTTALAAIRATAAAALICTARRILPISVQEVTHDPGASGWRLIWMWKDLDGRTVIVLKEEP